eukprot:CAMPEP_0118954410 /NCGR_PEP_ID=MMETSP1169-20130426/58192_1 /TAXON_ID=36882 /ORGANISM="Pyramimonas obovata, Strain CCMP722" /LENGTH=271 /DNA_ID=CAMNT_0006902037 /DNA_START=132 /DNA_END=943 /DNA_ORIENTATION=+
MICSTTYVPNRLVTSKRSARSTKISGVVACRAAMGTPTSLTNADQIDTSPKRELLTLAALDVGSGATKLEIARVDTSQDPWSIVGEVLFSEQATLLLAGDLKAQSNNCLSDPIMDSAIDILRNFKSIAEKHDAVKLRGIATAVFRLADNAPELLARIENELGIKLTVVSQDEEGEIGFLTAATGAQQPAASDEAPAPPLDLSSVVAWDSGGASFQLTVCDSGPEGKQYQIYQGPLGASLATAQFVEEVQNRPWAEVTTPNPISLEEAEALR